MEELETGETTYDGRTLTIRHTLRYNTVQFAYFAPYTLANMPIYSAGLKKMERNGLFGVHDSRSLHRSSPNRNRKGTILVYCTTTYGKNVAEWWMEGFIHALLDKNNPISHRLKRKAAHT